MSLWICPLCGKQVSIRYYDPTDFHEDIIIIRKRGLGRGMGFEVVEEYSLLDGSNPELLDLIRDRAAIIYDLLYEDVEVDEEHPIDLEDDDDDEQDSEPLSELDKELLFLDQEEEENEDINDVEENIIE